MFSSSEASGQAGAPDDAPQAGGGGNAHGAPCRVGAAVRRPAARGSDVFLSPGFQMYVHHGIHDLIFNFVGTLEAGQVRLRVLDSEGFSSSGV